MKRVRLGKIYAHDVTFREALTSIAALVDRGDGGFVVTPNVDHVVQAEQNQALREAYEAASLSLVDGKPLVWLSRLLGRGLPEKISGSDLVEPLMKDAAAAGWRVFLLGGAEGVGERAAEVLRQRNPGLRIAGIASPPMGFDQDAAQCEALIEQIARANTQLVLVALGCPKQELFMHRWETRLAPAVCLGVGASLDFLSGTAKRSPKWMSDAGLEWAFRLVREPRRLSHRYLVRDPQIIRIAWRMIRVPRDTR